MYCWQPVKQTAMECVHPGHKTSRGRFTYHLLRHLRITGRANIFPQSLTYVALVDEVARRLKTSKAGFQAGAPRIAAVESHDNLAPPSTQQPHCEGSHRSRIVFTMEDTKFSDSFPLAYERSSDNRSDALYVAAGSIHGVVSPGAASGDVTRFVCRHLPRPPSHSSLSKSGLPTQCCSYLRLSSLDGDRASRKP